MGDTPLLERSPYSLGNGLCLGYNKLGAKAVCQERVDKANTQTKIVVKYFQDLGCQDEIDTYTRITINTSNKNNNILDYTFRMVYNDSLLF